MIKIVGNDAWRGTEKIGFVTEGDVYDHARHKLGYCSDNDIYDRTGRKVAYLEGNYIHTTSGRRLSLSDTRNHIVGGDLSDLERAAVQIFLGD